MTAPMLRLNGNDVKFKSGQTILDVATDNGIFIPTLCYLKDATPTGSCRMCVVEVKGAQLLVAACAAPASEGMEIRTDTERVHRARKLNIELLLAGGNHNCLTCEANGNCLLQDLAYYYGITEIPFNVTPQPYPVESDNPFIIRDFSRCVLCGRCVQACNEVVVNRAIGYGYRGADSKIVAGMDQPYIESDCVFCGQCVEVCPVGALIEKKSKNMGRQWELNKVRTTCPYCGVGCQMWLHTNKDGRIVKITAVEDGAPNKGRLCAKGRFAYDFIYSQDRLTSPLIKENGEFREASWDEALDLVVKKFTEIKEKYGPDSIAGVSCARSTNEDSYQMQKLFRSVIGTNNIDHCARACHAPTVAGLAASFGSGAMTNSFEEFGKAKMFLCIGTNMVEAHPVAATFLKNAVLNGAKLIVVDPRKHPLTSFATLHVPIKVGSDIAFLNGVMNVLIAEDLYCKEFVSTCCTGFEEFKDKVMEYPPEVAAEICGISGDMIRDVARRLAAAESCMLCYTLGITEHTCGKNNVMSTANLQMLLGNMGKECGGVNPLRGQNNVQGACDMGALPNVFPGYQAVTDSEARAKFEKAWGVENLPGKNGLTIPQMMEGLTNETIKAFYVFGENLANSEPHIAKVEHELASAEFIVCQDIFPTETTRFADVILPAAAWCEDDGTFTNSERRVSRVRKVGAPPGIARPNWWIFKELAKRMGHEWSSGSAREIWDNEISVLAPSLTGIKYRRIENDGLQWPCTHEDHSGTCFLHQDGCFTCGLGRFNPVDWTPPAEVADKDYPFVLSTGRRLYHYHTRTQTGRAGMDFLLPEETADISSVDAQRLGIEHDEMIKIRSRRGSVKAKANVTDQIPPGMVWMAFHFREACANWLTNPAFDPNTMTAEYKACAVAVEKL